MKVALYARYSSDSQREASIADQMRLCREHAHQVGWQIVEEYSDHAVSGASLLRPGIQALMRDAQKGHFDIVVAEALDRLSRDQEDIAGLHKRMSYAGVKIITLGEGEISSLHVGLKGTMNALFLKDLADKTRRGLRGRIENGKSGGGKSYGYDVIKQFDASGEPIRGDRTINEAEAQIIRSIFTNYNAGKSPKKIAADLNIQRVAAPGGKEWGFSTINGNARRGTGILNNELYIGRMIWNRQTFIKDPDSGKRQARPNTSAAWISKDVPDLRIIDDEVWQMTKARQRQLMVTRNDQGGESGNHFRDRRRPTYLLSGLVKCGCCGAGYAMISAALLGCSKARNNGTCNNPKNMRRDELEYRVLNGLKSQLMHPDLFKAFCDEFTRETNKLRMNGSARIDAAKAELVKIEKQIAGIIGAIADGMYHTSMKDKMTQLEARKLELQQVGESQKAVRPLLHPKMATIYHNQIDALYELLNSATDTAKLEATGILRTLISRIVLTPMDSGMEVRLEGDLAGILSLAAGTNSTGSAVGLFERKKPPLGAAVTNDVELQVKMVAGAGFEPAAFRL